jgi:protein-tyrosine phosphatase
MTQVWERLFIGRIGDAEALAESNPFGITTVITLCRKPVRAKAEGINYLRFPIIDARPLPVGRLDAIIDAMWENIRWGTLLVVSQSGTTRAPLIAAAWVHCCGYKNIDAALAEIRAMRTIEPNPVLLSSVKELL